MQRDPDVVVIGSGPNGLVAACVLAQRGFRVLVLEANPRRPGGAAGTEEATLPGFLHDIGAAFVPLAMVSRAYHELDLTSHGLEWMWGEVDSAHPARDGSCAAISRDPETSGASFGSERDARRWRKLVAWQSHIQGPLFSALLGPLPSIGAWLRVGIWNAMRLGLILISSTRRLSEGWFETESARRVIPSLALHADAGPDDALGGALGYVLGITAGTVGFPIARGGTQSITNALVTLLEEHGGRVRLGARVDRVLVRERRAVGVRLAESGEEIAAKVAVLADTAAPTLLLDLLQQAALSPRVVKKMQSFRQGWGTFKLDWALSGAVPWNAEAARKSAVVHLGESIDELARFTSEVRSGKLPSEPYLVIGQQSLIDPSRAPEGKHTLYAYTHAPSNLAEGWDGARERFADRIDARIEAFAPGFRDKILGRRILAPPDLAAQNPNLVGGDLGGGSNAWHNQLFLRPMFPYFRYRMPIDRLYLCSSYAHPGGGAHGMCGYNAAHALLDDVR